MTSTLASSWRSFWHTMTSNDRHASPDSPLHRSGHLALGGRDQHCPLTSVSTAAMDSRADLHTDEAGFTPTSRPMSPHSPYQPGMRSMQRQASQPDTSYAADGMNGGAMPMQSFADGSPPPPPIAHSWKRIDRWLEDNYEELGENLGEGCTHNDVNELEHELDVSLPQDVRDSLMIHDGQERGGRPTGVLFSCMLLDCEEIVQEYRQWARTNEEYLREPQSASYSASTHTAPLKAFAGSSTSAAAQPRSLSPASSTTSNWRSDLLSRQESQPASAVQKAYVHPGWIPLARDWGGNNICVDLAPGTAGKYGQIILMGRDYDVKPVIARSWSAFLANVADDMSTTKWFIDEETHELKLREFPKQNVEPGYMDILRWRADQKYGRRFKPAPQEGRGKRPAQGALRINSQVKGEFASLNGFSPYASPTSATEGTGRSPPTLSAGHSASNKQPPPPSPLGRVAEESGAQSPELGSGKIVSPRPQRVDRLVSIDSPVIGSGGFEEAAAGQGKKLVDVATPIEGKENGFVEVKGEATAGADEMKTVQI